MLDALELQHDPECGRDLSHVLLKAFSGAFEQAGKLAPGELRSVFLRQVFLDKLVHVGERLQRQHVGDDNGPRQRARPIGAGQGLVPRDTKGLDLDSGSHGQ
jgi:hypothetical protein